MYLTLVFHFFYPPFFPKTLISFHSFPSTQELNTLESVDVLAPTEDKLGDTPFVLYHILTKYHSKLVEDRKGEDKIKAVHELPESNIVEVAAKAVSLAKLLYNEVVTPSKSDKEAGEKLKGLKKDINDDGKKLFSDKRVKNSQLYFFYLFRDESKIQSVCKWGTFLEDNGLNEYNITISEDGADMFQPLYVINPQNPLHRYYIDVRNAVCQSAQRLIEYTRGMLNGVNSTVAANRICIVRMMLVSVMYYEYFNKNRGCDAAKAALRGNLKGLLNINDKELPAFMFFASGPLTAQNSAEYFSHLNPQQADNIPNLDPLYSVFSSNGRKETDGIFSRKHTFHFHSPHFIYSPIFLTDFMANLLAVTLGCPKDSTHMYERIFDIGVLNGAKCPGSGKYRLLMLLCSFAHSLTLFILQHTAGTTGTAGLK